MICSSHRRERKNVSVAHSLHRPRPSLVHCFGRAIVLAGALGASTHSVVAQQTTFIAERGIAFPPQDVAITPSGLLAVVRSAGPVNQGTTTDEVTVWDVPTGTRIPIANAPPDLGRGQLIAGTTSDGIAITNDVAVVIGSASLLAANNTTVIDVIRLSGGPPRAAGHFIVNQNTTGQNGGLVSDVAITPDGTKAVINHRNWVHVLDLTQDPATATGFQIGFGDPCFPGPQSDSVAVTNDRAVVVTTRVATNTAKVFIYSLTGVPVGLGPPLEVLARPHDVAVTPDGTKAVVTFNDRFVLFDLATGQPTFPNAIPRGDRLYGLPAVPVDSVELTNNRAVLLSHLPAYQQDPPTGKFLVEVWDIANLQNPLKLLSYECGENHQPHDLAVFESDGKAYALVTAGREFAALDAGMQVAIVGIETSNPTAHSSTNFATPFAEPGIVFCSDSAEFLVSNVTDSTVWGLAMGSGQIGGSPWVAASRPVKFTSPPAFAPLYVGVQDPEFDTIAVDFAKSHNGTDYLMRTFAPPGEDLSVDPLLVGRDLLRSRVVADPPMPRLIAQLGAQGESNNLRMLAVDSIASSGDYTVSIAELTSGSRKGYVHFVRNTP